MKTFTKVILILAGVFITIGLIAVIIAVALGAKFNDNYPYKTYNFNDTYNDVKSLNIKIGVGEVLVKEGEKFKIDAKDVIKDEFNSYVTDGVWTIEENRHKRFLDLFWEMGKGISFINYSPKITIYVPKDTELDKFDITIGAGKGTIEVLNTNEITTDVGTGSLIINNLKSKKSYVESGVGSISINGIMTGYNRVKNGVGDINLNLIGNANDYNYKYSVGVGNVIINNSTYSKGSGDGNIDNDASNDFDMDCGVGNIKIEIKE